MKLYFVPFNNIINSFKSNAIAINFFTTFLQTVEVENLYWFALGHCLHHFLTVNIHSLRQQFVKKFVALAFLLVKTIKKSIDLKSKTKYTSPKIQIKVTHTNKKKKKIPQTAKQQQSQRSKLPHIANSRPGPPNSQSWLCHWFIVIFFNRKPSPPSSPFSLICVVSIS